ncbi:FGGY-family carbohydrate kinase [Rhodobacter sp. KR11]|uniref:FGGY-family carbohydrate kinase n=1 Tax=Rhodobacter sp. KR11 TaxID=2974588 RepID=UPI0022231F69|nr:FGGY-family carbohydrate kinase [Rhodobacter sp. KR11]MCW1920680.1 FGGY-family carbohydrate kinase [Rhodobacter sp. KR11]
MLTLGIDIGTFESKGVLVDERGRVVAEAHRPHKMIVPRPGWAEHRAIQDWWDDLTFLTKALLAKADVKPSQVAAVACSAIGPCMLPLDRDGQPLMNAVLYGVDTRASAEIAQLNAQLSEPAILAHCGNALTSQAVGPKILWLRHQRPDIWEKTDRITTSTSYLTWRLTGEHVIDHYTAANFAPLYDITAQTWNPLGDICPPHMLPRLMWAQEIAGHITPQAATETGLAPGTPVLCGTIDAAAEAVSVGVAAPGQMMMMYGSTVFTIQVTANRQADPRLWHAPWLYPGTHAVMAGLATSGTLTHWFRDHFARDLDPATAFATLTAEAAQSPKGAKGLICLPYFSGERVPLHDPQARGVFFGLNLTHGRGDLYRAVLEGIAAATAQVVEAHGAARPQVLRAVGGGTRNPVWLQATSDLTGLAQEVTSVTLGASYGDAWMAARALGAAPDITAWNPVERRILPERVTAYDRQYPIFQALYARTRDLMAAL